jgi:hypothetical protein
VAPLLKEVGHALFFFRDPFVICHSIRDLSLHPLFVVRPFVIMGKKSKKVGGPGVKRGAPDHFIGHKRTFLDSYAMLYQQALDTNKTTPCMRIAIYTDNSNTVDLFNTLHAQPLYNPLLITAVNLLLDHGVDLRVFHIPRQDNIVADALSRFRFDTVALYAPSLQIFKFQPPRLKLGAAVL